MLNITHTLNGRTVTLSFSDQAAALAFASQCKTFTDEGGTHTFTEEMAEWCVYLPYAIYDHSAVTT